MEETDVTDFQALQKKNALAQAADAALTKFKLENPEFFKKPESHDAKSVVKNAMVIFTGVMTFAVCTTGVWVVSSIGEFRETIARIDERQKAQTEAQNLRMAQLERRLDEKWSAKNDR